MKELTQEQLKRLEAIINVMNSRLLMKDWKPTRTHYERHRDDLVDIVKGVKNADAGTK